MVLQPRRMEEEKLHFWKLRMFSVTFVKMVPLLLLTGNLTQDTYVTLYHVTTSLTSPCTTTSLTSPCITTSLYVTLYHYVTMYNYVTYVILYHYVAYITLFHYAILHHPCVCTLGRARD